MKGINDGFGGSGRNENGGPNVCGEVRIPGLGDRRHLSERVRARRAGDGEGAKLTFLYMLDRRRQGAKRDRDMAAERRGKVAQPLRAALTGRSVSPPVFDVMAVLGREEALARVRDQAK